jgi:hypothetical protein
MTDIDHGNHTQAAVGLRLSSFSLGAASLVFVANYLFNHAAIAHGFRGTVAYFGSVVLPFGIVLPAMAVGRLASTLHGHGRVVGFPLAARDGLLALAALGFGVFVASFPIGSLVLGDPGGLARVTRLFVALVMTSLAEVLVFVGIFFVLVESIVATTLSDRGRYVAPGSAILVSAFAFGLYHFTYPAPWNTWDTVRTLTIVWFAVATLYAVTRSLLAAVVFNNVMAVIGFVLRDLALPASVPLGLSLGAVACGAAAVTANLAYALRLPAARNGE